MPSLIPSIQKKFLNEQASSCPEKVPRYISRVLICRRVRIHFLAGPLSVGFSTLFHSNS